MIIRLIIELLECIIAPRKVRSESGRIVISKRPLVQMEDVVVIVGKTGNFLHYFEPFYILCKIFDVLSVSG